jgi:glycine cleavage system aminomethyltransferase T
MCSRVLFSQGRGFYIVTNGLSAYHTWAHIHYVVSEKNFRVGLTDLSEKIGVLAVQGPKRCVFVCVCHTVIFGHGFTDPGNK